MAESPPIRVLFVEDDEDDFVLARDLLRQSVASRFLVDWEPDYDRGLAALCGGRYDACLVDYRLGARNGVDWLGDAAARGCATPVILLTGQPGHDIDLAAMNAGAADFLNKSQITTELLERAVRYAIAQKKAEDQRLRLVAEQTARAQAEAANRAKDQFFANLSHELRTPLTPVLMAVSSLQEDPELPRKFRADVEMIRRNVELEARLIDDLLDLTRITRGKLELCREATDLHNLLGHIARSCADECLGKAIRLDLAPAAADAHVFGDAARLQQVFWNLIKNAVKFTPEEGRIEIRTLTPRPGRVRVEVGDTGIGIAPDVLPRIFDAFEQGDRTVTQRFGGLGLGLAISKAICDMHGGTISAASEGPGRGATFAVELPTCPAPAPPSAAAPTPQAGTRAAETEANPRAGNGRSNALPAPGPASSGVKPDGAKPDPAKPLRILLVEDHASSADVLSRLLRRYHHDVSTARDIASAHGLADAHPFDLVISDLGLPDGSGLDLMRDLRQRHGLAGIALSGYGMEEDIRRSLEAGFAQHLTKPVNLTQLQTAIARVSGRA